jgi:1-acyl-sn-glycerol-3-phosphate acyltransferase
MIRRINQFILHKIWGWKIEGHFPLDTPKYLAIGGPHTSNWDFILSIMSRQIQGAKIKFIAKSSLFRFPLGWLMRQLGGYPVDRKEAKNYVDFIVDTFNNKEQFAIAITPEGTRKKVDRLKTGFYYIARGAKIPIVITIFDAGNKTFRIMPPYYLSENLEEELNKVASFYRGIKGINPEDGVFF